MCYNVYIANLNTSSSPKCSQCSSELILLTTVTEKPEGSFYPQVISTYRCSNEPCQAEIDKETAKRVKIRNDKKIETDRRAEVKLKEKEALKKLALSNT